MTHWKITGFAATIVIVLSIPLYLVKVHYFGSGGGELAPTQVATFVGRTSCQECHKKEYDLWQDSDHDKAMDIATQETVLGDFDNAEFEHDGIVSRFYRKGDKFYVHTTGPEGEMGDFEIAYVFGVTPLQQYLVPFEGGRLQCLPIAWDTGKKKWYHLFPMVYPGENIGPDNWLYWTNAAQNWNGMCAECHSTRLQKKIDPKTGTYKTSWFEIDVSCEACHGPGSLHVEWANLSEMARAEDNNGLVAPTNVLDNRTQVELCAPCHARRSALGDNDHTGKALLDQMIPQLLLEPLYFPDGQILDEVYVYGSFVQSDMYAKGVRCGDCHDVHSTRLVKQGNALCLQCHRADQYAAYNHHFHKKEGQEGKPIILENGNKRIEVGEGADCVKCHMPGRTYMGVDYRRDHSMRVPRPDLSVELGTPNACNHCHADKSPQWAVEYTTKWYGIKRKPHYGTVLADGRKREPGAEPDLIRLANDPLFPVIVRATSLSLLSAYSGDECRLAIQRALDDPEALLRHTAIRSFNPRTPQDLISSIAPLVQDPVKAVRIQAAMKLTVIPDDQFSPKQRAAFQAALVEYQESMEHVADFATGRHNLGNMYSNLGQLDKAAENYKEAIAIDDKFYPAKANLALLYNRIGDNGKAEKLYLEMLKEDPDLAEVSYSLGLLLVETKKYAEAATYLESAAEKLPDRARIHYNLGLLFQYLKREREAEAALMKALEIEPENLDFLYAAADHYLKRGRFNEAKRLAERMVSAHPSSPIGQDILSFITRNSQSGVQTK